MEVGKAWKIIQSGEVMPALLDFKETQIKTTHEYKLNEKN